MHKTLPRLDSGTSQPRRSGSFVTNGAIIVDVSRVRRSLFSKRDRTALASESGTLDASALDPNGRIRRIWDELTAETVEATVTGSQEWNIPNAWGRGVPSTGTLYRIEATDDDGNICHSLVDARYHEPMVAAGFTPRVSTTLFARCWPGIVYVDADGEPVAVLAPIRET